MLDILQLTLMIKDEVKLSDIEYNNMIIDFNNNRWSDWKSIVENSGTEETMLLFESIFKCEIPEMYKVIGALAKCLDLDGVARGKLRHDMQNGNISEWNKMIKNNCSDELYNRFKKVAATKRILDIETAFALKYSDGMYFSANGKVHALSNATIYCDKGIARTMSNLIPNTTLVQIKLEEIL
ncbi:hypothetical protein J6A31_05835 [bacterium]|nr:hypothetical protein [bacterium]